MDSARDDRRGLRIFRSSMVVAVKGWMMALATVMPLSLSLYGGMSLPFVIGTTAAGVVAFCLGAVAGWRDAE